MKKCTLSLFICVSITGCNTIGIKESVFGLEEKDYLEPPGNNTATLIVDAPKLKRKMMIEDKITVSFYNSCTDRTAFRSEGYIGSFDLSSKGSIGKSRTVKIPTDAPLFVEVGYSEINAQCTNKFRILPESGSTYKIHWEYEWGWCSAHGSKVSGNGDYIKSDDIEQLTNEGGFWKGASGRTTSEWRSCSNS